MRSQLKKPSGLLRGPISQGLRRHGSIASRVEREGGDSGAGLIRGVSVISRGEAVGHDMWIDHEFLAQTEKAINDAGAGGIKSRFTHPGLSGDGLGRLVGRIKDGRVIGDQTFGDLHISETSHTTPDGDLGTHVMDLAEKEPDLFGTSIVFSADEAAENAFTAEHQDRQGRFVSPDEDNRQQLPHTRLAELRADDLVDEPAANPEGLFHRGDEIADEAERMMSYALSLPGAERPQLTELDVDPQRIRRFVKDYLERHHLTLVSPDTVLSSCRALREQLK